MNYLFQDCKNPNFKTKHYSKVFSVGCQKIQFNIFDTSGDGEDEEFSSACRQADSVLLCYTASDLQSLTTAVSKWLGLVRRLSAGTGIPIVLVGCKGDAKEGTVNTMLDSEEIVRHVNAVMHVETSAATNSKSVTVAFQVAALACFTHIHSDRGNQCTLQRALYSVPAKLTVKTGSIQDQEDETAGEENIYSNIPPIPITDSRHAVIDNTPSHTATSTPISIETQPAKIKTKQKSPKKIRREKLVTIECQRLNKHKILEKINVDVSTEVYEALQKMNPEILLNSEGKEQPHSADFYLEKSVQEVKSALQCLKVWRAGVKKQSNDRQTTCL